MWIVIVLLSDACLEFEAVIQTWFSFLCQTRTELRHVAASLGMFSNVVIHVFFLGGDSNLDLTWSNLGFRNPRARL